MSMVLVGGQLFLQRRPHPLFNALIAVLGATILVLTVLSMLGFRY